MSLGELLLELDRAGAKVEARGGELRVQAPPGALDEELWRRLRERKKELLRKFQSAEGAVPAPDDVAAGAFVPSHGQRALWFVHRLAPESSAYNLAYAAPMRAETDRERLREALFEPLFRIKRELLNRWLVGDAIGPRQEAMRT